MTLKHAQAELKTKQAEVKKMDGGYKKDQDSLKDLQASQGKLQAELSKLNYEGMRECVSVCVGILTPLRPRWMDSVGLITIHYLEVTGVERVP